MMLVLVMKKEKTKTEKTPMTIRIKGDTIEEYKSKLEEIYGKKHKKIGTVIEVLLDQFNKQNAADLRYYIKEEKPIVNLADNQTIKTDYENRIKEIEQEHEKQIILKDQQLQEKQEKIAHLEHELKNIKENNETIKESLKETQKAIKSMNKTIESANKKVEQQEKDTRTARNDYKHIVETHNKLQEEYIALEKENKQYAVIIAEVKKMSLLERIIGKYPENIKELPDTKKDFK